MRSLAFFVRTSWLTCASVACAALFVSACTSNNGNVAPSEPKEIDPNGEPRDEPIADANAASDGSSKDAGGKDAEKDSAKPDDILGALSGSCGEVAAQLTSTSPSVYSNTLVFVAGEKYEKASLSPDGQRIFDMPNAGGSSIESEVMSLEVLRHCEDAKLLKTETEVEYAPPDGSGPSTITDILVEIAGKKVGVSVTRAYKPSNMSFPDSEVKALVEKKLVGINRSSVRVLPQDKWVKQILHVFTANKAASDAVLRVLPQIDAAIRADTVVVLTQTTGGGFVYCNPDPALGSECP